MIRDMMGLSAFQPMTASPKMNARERGFQRDIEGALVAVAMFDLLSIILNISSICLYYFPRYRHLCN